MSRAALRPRPVRAGIIGAAAIALALLVGLNAQRLPFIGGGRTYSAAFAEASGLRPKEEVRIAGVKAGTVTGVRLEGDHVRVDFRVDRGVAFGTRTRAEIKLKTLLGTHYVALVPGGPGRWPPGRQIPLSRTSVPYEIVPAVGGLATDLGQIDARRLAAAFDALSGTFENSPEEIRSALSGLRRLSGTIASRDRELTRMLAHARDVSRLLADRRADIAALAADAGTFLRELHRRREVIHQVLTGTARLARQIEGLVADNERHIGPALRHLRTVVGVLRRHRDGLERAARLYGPVARQLTDVTGSGRWIDAYLQNIVPVPPRVGPPR
ncbi:MCE family protein [Actinomadura sp. 21ATH]|uniref:MCE family protein n=1 Tax=Actinomadura sp. 21ATH TaxID=1735444 RepID=UPI0035C018C2